MKYFTLTSLIRMSMKFKETQAWTKTSSQSLSMYQAKLHIVKSLTRPHPTATSASSVRSSLADTPSNWLVTASSTRSGTETSRWLAKEAPRSSHSQHCWKLSRTNEWSKLHVGSTILSPLQTSTIYMPGEEVMKANLVYPPKPKSPQPPNMLKTSSVVKSHILHVEHTIPSQLQVKRSCMAGVRLGQDN